MTHIPKCPVCGVYMDYDSEEDEWFCLDSCDNDSLIFMEEECIKIK